MLRKIRRTLGVLCLVFVTLLFVDFTGVLHAWLGWMAKIQFLPALFALNAGVIVCLILLTLIAGRVYCSVICPLGVFQDVVARLGRGRKKMPYTYSKPKSWLRYGVLVIYVLAVLLGRQTARVQPHQVFLQHIHETILRYNHHQCTSQGYQEMGPVAGFLGPVFPFQTDEYPHQACHEQP